MDSVIAKWTTVVYISIVDHGGSESEGMTILNDKDAGQMKIRLPLPLKTWLQNQANASRRTLTAEVIVRLQASRERQLAAQQPGN